MSPNVNPELVGGLSSMDQDDIFDGPTAGYFGLHEKDGYIGLKESNAG